MVSHRSLLSILGLIVLFSVVSACAQASTPEVQAVVKTVIVTEVVEVEGEEAVVTEIVEVEVEEPLEVETETKATIKPAPTQPILPTPQPTRLPAQAILSPTSAPLISLLTPTPLVEERIVELEWPDRMLLGDSDTVRLALIPSKDGYTVTTEFPDHQTLVQDVPVLRPSGYDLYAVARLDGVGFLVSPESEQVRNLPEDQSVIWHWSLKPQHPGQQRLTVTLLLRWVPLAGTSGSIREAVAYSKGLNVRVLSFFGLTRGQAMTTGLFGLIFGVGLSLIAIVFRSRSSRSPLHISRPNPLTAIESPAGLHLSSQDEVLLRTLFSRYARVVINSEFLSGYSGARTLLLIPIRRDGRADAYTITKIGVKGSIQNEYQNYENFVKHTLPPITARIQSNPVSVRGGTKAALQYTFIGEPGSTPTSLSQALLSDPDPRLIIKLFDTFGPSWWMQKQAYTFRLAQEYDRLLPPHYIIEPDFGKGSTLDGSKAPVEGSLSIGQRVVLKNFVSISRRADAHSFSLKGEFLPGHPALRVRWLGSEAPIRTVKRRGSGQVGRIVATRDNLLNSYVSGFDLFGLPDPLERLPGILNESVIGSQSTIHGDLNLENILVGPGDIVWLIDFATTRDGHPLFDFAHLKAEVIAHVIAPQISDPNDYLSLLEQVLPYQSNGSSGTTNKGLHSLLSTIHLIAGRCLFNTSQPREFYLACIMACLGALKYRNLKPHQKHLLYLTGAFMVREL